MSGRRRILLFLLFMIPVFLLAACRPEVSGGENDGKKTIRFGYQKFGIMTILKAEGTLDERLKKLGYDVVWTEFPGGPQMLEALNAGSIDFGATGEAPPIFAQAAGAPIVYFANEPENPRGEAIVVPKNSPIQTVSDLKGKRIALNKGSNVHYLLVRALEEAGLDYDDVETVFLPPSDARVAFEKGSVDAWAIWDPFLADAEFHAGARQIADGTNLVDNREFFLATKSLAKEHPDVLEAIFEELERIEVKMEKNQAEIAEFLSPQVGIGADVLEAVLARRRYGVERASAETLRDQQKIADKFYDLGLIPERINISEASLEAVK